MSHILTGCIQQIVDFKLEKEFSKWIDKKKDQYDCYELLSLKINDIRDLLLDNELAAYRFYEEFSLGKISI